MRFVKWARSKVINTFSFSLYFIEWWSLDSNRQDCVPAQSTSPRSSGHIFADLMAFARLIKQHDSCCNEQIRENQLSFALLEIMKFFFRNNFDFRCGGLNFNFQLEINQSYFYDVDNFIPLFININLWAKYRQQFLTFGKDLLYLMAE